MRAVSLEVMLSVALGLIFLAAALPKLRHPKGFVLAVLDYRILPPALSRVYGLLIPPLEFLIALLLLSGVAVRSAAAVASALMASFIVGVGVNMVRGRDLDCHCFGQVATRTIGWGTLLQDSALLATTLVTVAVTHAWVGVEPWSVLRLSGLVHTGDPWLLLAYLVLTACATVLMRRSVSPGRWDRRHIAEKAGNTQAATERRVAAPRR